MTPRERVMRALKLQPGLPDRIPVQFDLCKSLLEYFSKKLSIPLSITDNLYEDVTWRISANEIRIALGSDVIVTGTGTARNFHPEPADDGTWLNEYCMRMKQGDIYAEITEYPLTDIQTAAEVKDYKFPDLSLPGRFDDAIELVKKYHTQYFIIGDIEATIFTLVMQLVGMEKLMMDMALGEEYLQPLIKVCTDFQIENGLKLIAAGVDAIWVGDDFGGQTGLLFSKKMFRELWKPHYKRMCDTFKKANPEITLILHCDGAVSELMDDFIEIGFQVFNPVQPGVPGHDPEDMKSGWGDRMAFWGAIDQQELIPFGTDEELEKDIQSLLDWHDEFKKRKTA